MLDNYKGYTCLISMKIIRVCRCYKYFSIFINTLKGVRVIRRAFYKHKFDKFKLEI